LYKDIASSVLPFASFDTPLRIRTSASVFLNNGNGTFAAKVDYTTGTAPHSIALGDVNGDGFDDILVGAKWNHDGGYRAGKVYLIYGRDFAEQELDLADADA